MGIGNFLKNAADKAAKKVQEVSQAMSEASSEAAERQKQRKLAEHMAAYEAERAKRRETLEGYKGRAPSCEKGDCSMCHENFFYTCPEDCACERKEAVDKSKQYALANPEYMPYIKWIEGHIQLFTKLLKKAEVEVDYSAIMKKAHDWGTQIHIPPHDRLPDKVADGIVVSTVFYDAAMAFIENELPDYSNSAYYLATYGGFSFSLLQIGFGKENKMLQFLTRAHESKLDIDLCPERFFEYLSLSILPFNKEEEFAVEVYPDVSRDMYYKPSLYQRSESQFVSTVLFIESTLDPVYFAALHPDIPYDEEKLMSLFLDENGEVTHRVTREAAEYLHLDVGSAESTEAES